MRRRVFESLGVAAVLAALVVLLQLSAQGQGEGGAAAPAGPAPKTALGHPDLQGIWLDEFQTPLERPAQYADREFLTEEERQQQDDERSGNVGRNRRVERGSQQDVAGAYNAVFTSAKPTGRRTSLVVEPANRVIELTGARAGGQARGIRRQRIARRRRSGFAETGLGLSRRFVVTRRPGGRHLADAVRDVLEHVEPRDALCGEELRSVRLVLLQRGREHVARLHFLASSALYVQYRGLEDATEGERLLRLLLLTASELLDGFLEVPVRSLRSCGRSAPQAARIRSPSGSCASA